MLELKELRKGNQQFTADISPLPPQMDPVGASVFTMFVPEATGSRAAILRCKCGTGKTGKARHVSAV